MSALRTGWPRWAAWTLCVLAIGLLGLIRSATDAELTFASLALVPVLVIAWLDGKRSGLFMAVVATAMWVVADGLSDRHYSAEWIPWANAVTRLMTYGLVAVLAAQVREQFEREHENARRDALTGLQNRRAFLEAGAGEYERSKRYVHSLAVIFLDLDDFKRLNDAKGHDGGDAALRATARALEGALRSGDVVARLGGDEFAVLLPEIGYDAAVDTGRKLSTAVSGALGAFPPVGVSVGVAWFGEADRPFPEMLKAADGLMYEAKQSGKGGLRSLAFAAEQRREQ